MGDTGSLALGGIFATISIMLNQELSLIFIGLVLKHYLLCYKSLALN